MIDKITTTLAKIRAERPCHPGYGKLCRSLGGVSKYGKDTPVTFRQIYDILGYEDTLWCLCAIDEKWSGLLRHYAVDNVEDVRHLLTDERSLSALRVARRFVDGEATDEELNDARAAARAAAQAAAKAAARDAAWDAVMSDAGDAARAASWDAARTRQMERLFEYCRTGERVK